MNKILLFTVISICSSNAFSNQLYRAPSAGDSGAYYVLEQTKMNDDQVNVLTSRIGKFKAYTSFIELKINCSTKQYFTLSGSSEDGEKIKPSKPLRNWSNGSKWTSIVNGSSKSDLVNFVCKSIVSFE